jgi:uncharacterized repeat protein (TIGR03943 family)
VRRGHETTVTIGLAAAVGSLLHSGIYLRYVRPQMYPLLVATAVTLAAIGLASLRRGARAARADSHRPDGGHAGHGHRARAGWFLAIPILATLIPPPALGASSIGRIAALTMSAGTYTRPLRPGTPVLTLSEFATRARYGHTLTDRDVTLEGFSIPSSSGGWNLTRLVIVCCAADALSVQVHVDGTADPGTNAWVRVTGRWEAGGGIPAIRAARLTVTQQPADPYE